MEQQQQRLFIPKKDVQMKVIHSLELVNTVLAAYDNHSG